MSRKRAQVAASYCISLGVVAAGVTAITLAEAAPPALEISRSTVDGGGVVHSVGGDYELSATIGQPDTGVLFGGNYQLSGGFWFGLSLADCNDDGLVNAVDHEIFVACMMGPGAGIDADPCPCFDTNGDGDITLDDFAKVQIAYSGP